MADTLLLLATDTTDNTITVALDGVKYEYWIRGDFVGVVRQFRRLMFSGANGKAINLLKSHSYKTDRLD